MFNNITKSTYVYIHKIHTYLNIIIKSIWFISHPSTYMHINNPCIILTLRNSSPNTSSHTSTSQYLCNVTRYNSIQFDTTHACGTKSLLAFIGFKLGLSLRLITKQKSISQTFQTHLSGLRQVTSSHGTNKHFLLTTNDACEIITINMKIKTISQS